MQGRLSTSAGQARPRIICGPASHLPTSYLLPPATILDLHGCSSRSSESRVCHHCRAGGPVTPTLTRVHLGPPGWSGSTWVHLAPPGHLCCSSYDHLPTWSTITRITNSYFFLFQLLPKSLSWFICEIPQGSRIHRQFFKGSNFKRLTHRDRAKFLPKILHDSSVCGFICFKRFSYQFSCSTYNIVRQRIPPGIPNQFISGSGEVLGKRWYLIPYTIFNWY